MELMHPRILQIGICAERCGREGGGKTAGVDRGARAAEPVPRRHEDGSR